MPKSRFFIPSSFLPYAIGLLAITITLVLRWLLWPILQDAVPTMFFFPAIVIAAHRGGFGPGLFTTLLSGLTAHYAFVRDRPPAAYVSSAAPVSLALFVLTGLIISSMSHFLHRSRRRIAATERRYALTLASIGDAVIATDNKGRVTFLNSAAEALTGWSLADAANRPLAEVVRMIDEETRQPIEDSAASVLRSGTLIGMTNHTVLLARDGREVPIDNHGAPIIDDRDSIVGAVLVCRDLSQRRRAEEAEGFRASEQRWRSLTEALPNLVWSATPDGACDFFSTQWTEHTGVAETELLGWGWLETLHVEDRARTRQFWLESVAGRQTYDIEYRVRRRDGAYRWFKTRGVPIRDGSGNIAKWFGTCTDITDLRQTEEALRASEERFRGTFENAAVGIAHTDSSGRFLRVNEKFCAILDYPRAELLQKSFQDITHPDDLALSIQPLAALMRGESSSFSLEKRYLRRDGSPVWVEMFVSLQRLLNGKPTYAIAVIQEITERKRLTMELQQAKEAAEAANRAKDEFLANVSHEIRTPMNAILGMTDLTLGTELTDGQRQSLKLVKSAADNLLGIINDLLDFAKIEAGKLELDAAEFSLRAAVGDTLRALAVRAHEKGLELIRHVQPDVPDVLVGDAGRLRQVLFNLVGNAIKFTDTGEVVVRVETDDAPRAEAEVGLRFTVLDTGIGISRDKQASIFLAFEQEDPSTTRRYGGTGLGLTIAARLVALMGGAITVDSEPGQGSCFSFTTRFRPPPHSRKPVPVQAPVSLHNLPVLVVDDNATNRHILMDWLRGWRMQPSEVGDATAALESLRQTAAQARPFAVVLLDARMPAGDGRAVAAKIRALPELMATRIILLTSGEPAHAHDLGIDAQLLKPVEQNELLETIGRVLQRDEAREIKVVGKRAAGDEHPLEPASSLTPHRSALRVLVAEDNEFNAQLLEQLLRRQGHKVELANNGRAALRLANQGAFDLLLLDIHMPELDGFQVAQGVRAAERASGRHLPIIALTARSRKEDREKCLAAGMDEFLAKPIQAVDLWATMDRVVEGRPIFEPGPSLLDPHVLLAACGNDAAILEKICQTFRKRMPDHLQTMQDALRDLDAPRLREAAHKFAGMVSAFSTVAGAVASEIEDQAADGELDKASALMERLVTMAKELTDLLSRPSLEALRQQATSRKEEG